MSPGESWDRDTGRQLVQDLRDHELFAWLDLDVEVVEPGRAVFVVPFDERFTNISSGAVHGGITAAVMDEASGFALRASMGEPSDGTLTTTDLNVRYVRPAQSDVRVVAEVVRAGSTMGVTECEATVEHEGEQKVVATGGTTFRLFRSETSDSERGTP